MTEIFFLGVGSAMPSAPADNYTALLVQHGEASVLLDAGPSIMRQLEATGLTAGDPTHVYVSHRHGDHILGFPMLLLNRILFWPDRPLVVMGTSQVLGALEQLATLVYPDLAARMAAIVQVCTLEEGAQPQPLPGAEEMTCWVAPGRHSVSTWGIRFDLDDGRSLAYSADTGPSQEMARLAEGVDLLAHDTFYLQAPANRKPFHSAVAEVAELADRAGVRALALVHREHTDQGTAEAYWAEASKRFGGQILVPQAGDRFTL